MYKSVFLWSRRSDLNQHGYLKFCLLRETVERVCILLESLNIFVAYSDLAKVTWRIDLWPLKPAALSSSANSESLTLRQLLRAQSLM